MCLFGTPFALHGEQKGVSGQGRHSNNLSAKQQRLQQWLHVHSDARHLLPLSSVWMPFFECALHHPESSRSHREPPVLASSTFWQPVPVRCTNTGQHKHSRQLLRPHTCISDHMTRVYFCSPGSEALATSIASPHNSRAKYQ